MAGNREETKKTVQNMFGKMNEEYDSDERWSDIVRKTLKRGVEI